MRKLKESSLSDFSSKLVKLQGLPNGTEIRLYRRHDGRRVRSDFTVKRKVLTRVAVPKHDDDETVSDFLEFARSLLFTNIEARGFEISLFGPDRERKNGNTLLRTVRSMGPLPREEDEDRALLLLNKMLENVGIEEATMDQVVRLHRDLRDILNGTLDLALLSHAAQILAKNL